MNESFSECECLAFDPFEGDFGSSDDRILKNKIVTARKERKCDLCLQDIRHGDRIRVMSGVYEGEFLSHVWCNLCCGVMAKSWEDDGEAYEQRAEIGRKQQEADHE